MVAIPQPNLKQNFGMTDIPNFVTFDNSTIAPSLLPTVSSMSVSAGTPSDTVSKVNPMPEPTNSSYTMGTRCDNPNGDCSGGTMSSSKGVIDMPGMMGLSTPSSRRTIKGAEWNKPSYNYQRTKRAETETPNTLGLVIGIGAVLIGTYGITKLLDTDFDDSGLLTGRVSATP